MQFCCIECASMFHVRSQYSFRKIWRPLLPNPLHRNLCMLQQVMFLEATSSITQPTSLINITSRLCFFETKVDGFSYTERFRRLENRWRLHHYMVVLPRSSSSISLRLAFLLATFSKAWGRSARSDLDLSFASMQNLRIFSSTFRAILNMSQ